jgi:hypothetical protein
LQWVADFRDGLGRCRTRCAGDWQPVPEIGPSSPTRSRRQSTVGGLAPTRAADWQRALAPQARTRNDGRLRFCAQYPCASTVQCARIFGFWESAHVDCLPKSRRTPRVQPGLRPFPKNNSGNIPISTTLFADHSRNQPQRRATRKRARRTVRIERARLARLNPRPRLSNQVRWWLLVGVPALHDRA